MALERAPRPSGCSRPGTPTRQSLVPGFFYPFIGKLPYIAGLHFACSNSFAKKRRPCPRASSLVGKETDERRTSNVQHRTSNNVFCPFKKRFSEAIPSFVIRQSSFVIPCSFIQDDTHSLFWLESFSTSWPSL
jgi:hypothetical protein